MINSVNRDHYILIPLLILIFITNLFTYSFTDANIVGYSMFPTIDPSNNYYINRIAYVILNPKIDDIVVFRINDALYVKRVKAINNNQYFMIGDNIEDSVDSRTFGSIDKKDIIGKLIY